MNDGGDTSATLPPRIGRYRVTGMLGRGAMGVVYRAHDAAIDREVAIKTIHRRLLRGEEGASGWSAFAAKCAPPAVACIPISSPCSSMARSGRALYRHGYVQGRELRSYLKDRQPLPLANAVAIVIQMLQALGRAHAAGVVHRDIKPANIILLADGQVKVTDFGIARLEAGNNYDPRWNDRRHARLHGTGTIQGLEADRRADLYATGVVLFELLTGTRPFPDAAPAN
ncbi:MAG: serine/threonine protein kinase [Gammaproteobacteria bacterium]|nr:serine/threonine protein kinase [Gammaproteobacteria bacterium]